MRVRDVIELRVHGVSGTPPEELLDRPLVERVAGDATAGFYRPRLFAERADSAPAGVPDPLVPGPELEGYVWGGLTSGAPSRAFWLLLLPFTLINVAPRMRPADPDRGSRAAGVRLWSIWFLCRLLALTMTIVLVAAFAGIGDDLIGWQCAAKAARCAQASPGWIFTRIADRSTPHRLAIGTLLPLAAIGLLWLISGRTMNRYEQVPSPLSKPADRAAAWAWADPPDTIEAGLRSRWMWQNEHPVRRLRAVHVQTALAATLWFASAPLTAPWRWLDGLVACAVVAYAIAAICVPSFTGHRLIAGWQLASLAIWFVLAGVYVANAVWLLSARHADDARYSGGGLPRFGDTILWLLFVELVLLLVLAVTVGWSSARAGTRVVTGQSGPPAGLKGMGTATLALLGVFLASVFTSGVYLYSATWLYTGSLKPGFGQISRISRTFTVPEAILDASWAFAVSTGVLLAFLIVVGLSAAAVLLRLSPTSPLLVPGSFGADYPQHLADAADASRRRTVLRAMWFGRVVDIAGSLIGVLLLIGAALTYVVAGALFAEHVAHANGLASWLLDMKHGRGVGGFFTPASLQGTGAYLVVVSLLLLVSLGALAFRVGPTRRSVGVLWDLASFWPRSAHPLAAPCYAERTVPDLMWRIRWHASNGTGVVLAAHSQGTVIGSAAILQLRTDDALTPTLRTLPQVGLLTFGCVLRRLYGRFFPAYFGPAAMRDVRTALWLSADDQRWRNLWRYTDYLGGPVLSGPPPAVAAAWDPGAAPASAGRQLDLHLIDPPFEMAPGDTVYSPPLRHSSYWTVPQFQQAVVRVGELIPDPESLSS
jgi:hypothetical protein